MKLLSFDIEIYNDLEEDTIRDYTKIIPSIGALCTNDNDVQYFYDEPYMSPETAKRLVKAIQEYYEKGYTLFAWNSTAFDLPIIAYYSGMIEQCARIALNSIDGMLLVTFNKGYYLGLDTALKGARIEGKTHSVTLNDGTVITDMSGQKAPELWRNGEYEAVKQYLRGDVIQPLKLAQLIEKTNSIKWFSKTDRPMAVFTKFDVVKNLFSLPYPNTSWMTDPPKRSDFVSWMPREILAEYGVFL